MHISGLHRYRTTRVAVRHPFARHCLVPLTNFAIPIGIETTPRKIEAPAFAGALGAITNLILSVLLVLPLLSDEGGDIKIIFFE